MGRKSQMTKATAKDIEYALQYGKEKLLKTINHERGNVYWTFAGTGRPVDNTAAQRFMANPHCMPMQDGLFEHDSQSFGWRD